MSGAPGRGRSSVPLVALLVVAAVVILGAGVALLARGVDDEPAGGAQGTVVVRDAWTAPNQGATAVYLTIHNPGADDRIVGASSDVATAVALMGGDVDMAQSNGGEAGAVSLAVPTGTIELGPGARHLMLQGLAEPLQPGSTIAVRLDFEDAGPVTADVAVVSWDEAADREG